MLQILISMCVCKRDNSLNHHRILEYSVVHDDSDGNNISADKIQHLLKMDFFFKYREQMDLLYSLAIGLSRRRIRPIH